MSKTGMLAAVAAAAGYNEEKAAGFVLNAETLAAHFPDVFKSVDAAGYERGKKEGLEQGADAEHSRLAGIEAAALPGHEAIVTAHKADRTKTQADTAMAIIGAQKAKMETVKTALATDEEKLSNLRSTGGDREAAGTAGNDAAKAREISDRAEDYMATQAARGIKVTAAEAVAHVSK